MKPSTLLTASLGAVVAFGVSVTAARALTVTQTTDGATLTSALVGTPGQFSSISASYTQGDPAQIGSYTGFSSAPVTFPNGVVISTGTATQVVGPADPAILAPVNPTTDFGNGSTPEIDAYAPSHVQNWSSSHDAAVLRVDFSLSGPAAIAFNFIFGSVEYPGYTANYTDAVYGFLDGTQIIFDAAGQAVQVGTSFASQLTTADTNTAFADPHGLLRPLTTTSGTLTSGAHTLLLEIADTNDGILDSAVFLSNLRTTTNPGGPGTEPEDMPEPAALLLLGVGLAGLALVRRRN